MSRRSLSQRFSSRLLLPAASLALLACAPASRMEGRISGLRQVIEEADANGARACAPRELALARAHLDFAEDLLERVTIPRAVLHVRAVTFPHPECDSPLVPGEDLLDDLGR